MVRAVDALEKLGDGVEVDPRSQAKIGGRDLEAGRRRLVPRVQSGPQRVVDDDPEWPARSPGSLVELRRHVIVQCQGRPSWHIMKRA